MADVQVRSGSSFGLCVLGLTLGVAIVFSTMIASQTVKDIKSEGQNIEVSGFSQKLITSDRAVWQMSFSVRAATLEETDKQFGEAKKKVVGFLTEKGAKMEDLQFDPLAIQSTPEMDERGTPTGKIRDYRITQRIQFSNSNIEAVSKMAENSSALVGMGVEVASEPPNYYYTKLDEMKMEMLGKAAANARARAEKLTSENKSRIGALRSVHQGVFQITSPYSNEVTDNGVNDVTSKVKSIKAIVTVRYEVLN